MAGNQQENWLVHGNLPCFPLLPFWFASLLATEPRVSMSPKLAGLRSVVSTVQASTSPSFAIRPRKKAKSHCSDSTVDGLRSQADSIPQLGKLTNLAVLATMVTPSLRLQRVLPRILRHPQWQRSETG